MFNFAGSKQAIIDILNDKTDITEQNVIPSSEESLTYSNGIKGWVAALFIDIRDSADYFDKNPDIVARVMRAYIQETISLIKEYDKNEKIIREIGIRGDCIYAIYTVPLKANIQHVFDVAAHIFSFDKMFQKILQNNHFPTFKIGIGLGANKDVAVKTGKPYSDVSDKIWIGRAVVDASHLSDLGNNKKYGLKTIVMNSCFFENLTDKDKKLLTKTTDSNGRFIYHGDAFFLDEEAWVERNL